MSEQSGGVKKSRVEGYELGWEGGGALGLYTAETGARYGFCLGDAGVVGSVCRSDRFGGGCAVVVSAVVSCSVNEVDCHIGVVDRVKDNIGLVAGYDLVS
jgi:hypothetical protein